MSGIQIKLKKLDKELPLPKKAYEGDAGMDLISREDATMKPGERALISTGIAIEIPSGYAGFIQPRSGLAIKHGIGVVNSPGLIDSNYRGEIKVILINMDKDNIYKIKREDKIAQLVIKKVESPTVVVVEELSDSKRGQSGFGSSG